MSTQASFRFQRLPKQTRSEMRSGIRKAQDNASAEWQEYVHEIIELIARCKREFTVDDVFSWLAIAKDAPTTPSKDAIGGAMLRAKKAGLIQRTDRVQRSKREGTHGNLQYIWESRVYEGSR